jgi:hypothetical protein
MHSVGASSEAAIHLGKKTYAVSGREGLAEKRDRQNEKDRE